jgi:hypothetical protein
MLLLTTTNSNFDTLLAVYTGDRLTNLVEVASNDDDDDAPGGVTTSKVRFGVRAQETYRIAVDGYFGSSGNVNLAYSFTPKTVYYVTVEAGSGGSAAPASGSYEAASTVVFVATPDPGYVFASWGGSLTSTDNPLHLLVDRDYTLSAHFRLQPYTEDFESGGFNPALAYNLDPADSAARWVVQTNSVAGGKFAARSGALKHGQSSAFILTVNLSAGSGTFAYRVSSEANWDELEFYLNGALLKSWSGDLPWTGYAFAVPAGTNTLEWRYTKDYTVSEGSDAAWIDNINLPLAGGSGGLGLLRVSHTVKGITLQLAGLPNRTYVIEASGDLIHWQPFSTHTAVDGLIQIRDVALPAPSARFYRARLLEP